MPIANAVAIAFEKQNRVFEMQRLVPHGSVQQRRHVDRCHNFFDAQHVRLAAPRRIGDAQFRQFDGKRVAPADTQARDRNWTAERPACRTLDIRPPIQRDEQQGGADTEREDRAEEPEDDGQRASAGQTADWG